MFFGGLGGNLGAKKGPKNGIKEKKIEISTPIV
jgi:hypothetical protein